MYRYSCDTDLNNRIYTWAASTAYPHFRLEERERDTTWWDMVPGGSMILYTWSAKGSRYVYISLSFSKMRNKNEKGALGSSGLILEEVGELSVRKGRST